MPSVSRLSSPAPPSPRALAARLALDGGRVDAALSGGLALAGCHEIYGPGSTALALMLALASPRSGPILWLADHQAGFSGVGVGRAKRGCGWKL